MRASAKASRPLETMVWNAEDARVPPGEKRGSGEGNLVLSLALWGLLMCPLAARQERPQERGFRAKSSTTDSGWDGGRSAMSSFQRPLLKDGSCPVSTQQDPDVLGREAVRESCRASMTRWPLCKLSDPAPQMGLVCATAWSGPVCLLRPDTHSREQQKRQADQCRAKQMGLERAPSVVPSSPWLERELSSRLLNT